MTKIEALAKYLDASLEDILEEADDTFSIGRQEYLVLTEEEANEMAIDKIRESIWVFNAAFIAAHTKSGLSKTSIEIIEAIQFEHCENSQEIIETLIEDLDHFVDDAIQSYGRGHFLSGYDGEENESGEFFIYRTN